MTQAATVADTYFQILSLNERIRLAQQITGAARRVLSLIQIRNDAGTASQLQVEQQRASLATFDATVTALQQQAEQALHALAVLTGRRPEGFTISAASLAGIATPAIAPDTPAALLERRPDIRGRCRHRPDPDQGGSPTPTAASARRLRLLRMLVRTDRNAVVVPTEAVQTWAERPLRLGDPGRQSVAVKPVTTGASSTASPKSIPASPPASASCSRASPASPPAAASPSTRRRPPREHLAALHPAPYRHLPARHRRHPRRLVAYRGLPISALPQIDFPTIQVQAHLPGASADHGDLGCHPARAQSFPNIPGLLQITSSSSPGRTSIVLQFDLSRNINSAAQDVQTQINSSGGLLPKSLPNPPTYSKSNPANAIVSLALTSPTIPLTEFDRYAEDFIAQSISRSPGSAWSTITASSAPPSASASIPTASPASASLWKTCARSLAPPPSTPQGHPERRAPGGRAQRHRPASERRRLSRPGHRHPQRNADAAAGRSHRRRGPGRRLRSRLVPRTALPSSSMWPSNPAPTSSTPSTRSRPSCPGSPPPSRPRSSSTSSRDRTQTIRASMHDVHPMLITDRARHPGDLRLPARCATASSRASRAGIAHRHLRRDVPLRLQPRQPVADGPHPRHRLRRRRRIVVIENITRHMEEGPAPSSKPPCSAPARSASPSSP